MEKYSFSGLFLPKSIRRRLAGLRDKTLQSKSQPIRRWRLLQLEAAIACNLRCVMCPWREISKNLSNQGLMSPEVWQAIRPYLSEISSIDFTGGGEPLLQPKLAEWIAEAKDAGCETGFLPNGLLLKSQKLEQILDAGLDWICISMDGATADMYEKIRIGSSFERVCENVSNIANLRHGNIPNWIYDDLVKSPNSSCRT